MIRLLAVIALMASLTNSGHASNPPAPELVGIFDLSELPAGNRKCSAELMSFVSDASIAIVLCPGSPTNCVLSLLRRDGSDLRLYASTPLFRRGRSIHASSHGQILITPGVLYPDPAILFSADLSVADKLPGIFWASQSGNTGASSIKDTWKLYRISSKAELIREGKGSLRSLSDEVVVFQDGTLMHVESLQGAPLGSFNVKPESKCYNSAYSLTSNTLYLDDCKTTRVVDFAGRYRTELHPPRGYRAFQSWSRDGSRILFDNFDRHVSIFRNVGEVAVAVGTLGTGVAGQKNNREEVAVLDTNTGNSCFEWRRKFPMGSVSLAQDAAISPSGEFIAIAADGKLRLYRLPQVCTGSR